MPSAQTQRVLSFAEARHAVEEHALRVKDQPAASEAVSLSKSLGRVLAEPVIADRDLPPFPRATRDGFAVCSADVAAASEASPIKLKVVAEVRAGSSHAIAALDPGQAAEIMTGAPVPAGADAVLMVEYSLRQGTSVALRRSARKGENIVAAGSEARRGDTLLHPGQRMDAPAIAVAASVGRSRLQVHHRPRVAILSTGDEIVDVASEPAANQIRNSNSYSLAAQVEAAGAEPVQLPIAPDERRALRELVRAGLDCDLLLLSGGVSMGKYDLVEEVLGQFDAEFFFTGALIQPGRPAVFGRAHGGGKKSATYFFGLPGNPVSTLVTFDLFARPMIDALGGAAPHPLRFLQAKLGAEIKTRTGLTRFLPARLRDEFENASVELVPWQGSGDVVAAARANCYIVVPPNRDHIPSGEMVAVMLR